MSIVVYCIILLYDFFSLSRWDDRYHQPLHGHGRSCSCQWEYGISIPSYWYADSRLYYTISACDRVLSRECSSLRSIPYRGSCAPRDPGIYVIDSFLWMSPHSPELSHTLGYAMGLDFCRGRRHIHTLYYHYRESWKRLRVIALFWCDHRYRRYYHPDLTLSTHHMSIDRGPMREAESFITRKGICNWMSHNIFWSHTESGI